MENYTYTTYTILLYIIVGQYIYGEPFLYISILFFALLWSGSFLKINSNIGGDV